MKTRVHVAHSKRGTLRAVIIQRGKTRVVTGNVTIDGPSMLIMNQKPNRYKATTWIETDAKVTVTR